MPPGREADARRFYGEILGIPEVSKPPNLAARGGCWFETATTKLHLGVEDGFSPARKAHPALLVDDLVALTATLGAHGIHIAEDEPLAGFDRVYISDPFGNRIELLQPL
jgi:catechol 2,3-dioxygenase-like lactoylglutathione lyase family enzyme